MQKISQEINVESFTFPTDPVTFDIDRELSKAYFGCSNGKGFVNSIDNLFR